MPTDNKTRIGLIGHPISHSQSPALFHKIFAERPEILHNYSYELIEEADFDKAYARFLSDYHAVNVTSPFKKLAFDAADTHSDEARLCGATNLLVKEYVSFDKWNVKAYNTDCMAVRTILREYGFGAGDTAIIYGCSGAGQAAAVAAHSLEMHISIINRTQATADAFMHKLGNHTPRSDRSIIIYTLPVAPEEAFSGGQLTSFLESLTNTTVLEANYRNPHLESLATNYISGLLWLYLQAIETYKIIL